MTSHKATTLGEGQTERDGNRRARNEVSKRCSAIRGGVKVTSFHDSDQNRLWQTVGRIHETRELPNPVIEHSHILLAPVSRG